MDTTNDRIRLLRKTLGLSQTDFAAALGCGRGTIKGIEEGRADIKPTLLDLIVRTYNVSPEWLESGEGEMFRQLTRQEQISEFVGKALADEPESFRVQLIGILASLDDVGWYKLEEAAKAIKAAEEKLHGK